MVNDNQSGGVYVRTGDSSEEISVLMQNEIVEGNVADGINVRFSSYSSITSMVLQNVASYDNAGAGAEIHYDNSQTAAALEIESCDFYGNTGRGLYVYGDGIISSSVFSSCTFYANGNDGCRIFTPAEILFLDNSAHDNLNHGISIKPTAGASVEIRGNESYGNAEDGIYCENSDALFIYNSVHENGSSGINFNDRTGHFIQNDIFTNGFCGVRFNAGDGVQVVNGNNIYDNLEYEIYNNTLYAVDARNNYWGTATTEAMNTQGYTADLETVYDIHDDLLLGMVDYRGWNGDLLDTSTDPVSYIVVPLEGMTLPRGNFTIEGVACASAGIALVEAYKDGGWEEASGTVDWTIDWFAGVSGPATVNSRAEDSDSNVETPGPGINVDVDVSMNHARGELYADETWSGDVYVTGDVIVPEGITLTVLPGSTVNFLRNRDDTLSGLDTSRSELIVRGVLIADGDPESIIRFTSEEVYKRDWYGIRFDDANDELCVLDHCEIKYAHAGISLESASVPITNCLVAECWYRGITGESSGGDIILRNNEILNNGTSSEGDGVNIKCKSSISVLLENTEIHGAFATGIHFYNEAETTNIDYTVMDNNIHDNGEHGLSIIAGSRSTNIDIQVQNEVHYNNVEDGFNIRINSQSSGTAVSFENVDVYDNDGDGIEVFFNELETYSGIEMADCEVYRNEGSGIWIRVSGELDEALVHECLSYENGGAGCSIGKTDILTVRNNEIRDNGGDGLWVRITDTGSVIDDNYIRENAGRGIHCEDGNAMFKYNTVRKNGSYGIEFERGFGTFLQNNIYMNQSCGLLLSDCASINEIHYNNIFRNATYEIYNNSPRAADARLNWWGDVATAQMDSQGYSVDIEVIYDIHDDFTLGMVDYRGWFVRPSDISKDPGSHITDPMDGMTIPAGPINIVGTAVSSAGLDHVDVSTDGGNVWNPGTGTAHWHYPWNADTEGTYNIRSCAYDAELNAEFPIDEGIFVDVEPGLLHTWGTIYEDETWSESIVIMGDVVVPAGVTLTVMPGTTVVFAAERDDTMSGFDDSRCELIVQGALNADGDSENEILFTVDSLVPVSKDWYGIRFVNPDASFCVMDHCSIQWAHAGISLESASIDITNCSISESFYRGITGATYGTGMSLQDCRIFDNGHDDEGDGVNIRCGSFNSLTVSENEFFDNFNCGIHCWSGSETSNIDYLFVNNLAYGNGASGFSVKAGVESMHISSTFQNETCYGNAQDGIHVEYSGGAADTEVILDNVVTYDNEGDGVEIRSNDLDGPSVVECVDCDAHGNGGMGIRSNVTGSISSLGIADCVIHENEGGGCSPGMSIQASISGMNIYDNNGEGLWIRGGNAELTENDVSNNSGTGIHCQGGAVQGFCNVMTFNGGDGFQLQNGSAVFHYNDINWNEGYGVRFTDSGAGSNFDHNNIYTNGDYEFYNNSNEDVSAQYCWWGNTVTGEMNELGYPADITRIYDVHENSSLGEVIYDNWLDGHVPTVTPTPGPTFTPGPPTYTPTAGPSPTPPVFSPTPPFTPTVTPLCLNDGDVDQNGKLTPQDAQFAFFIYLGVIDPTYIELCSADCLGEGEVTPDDAQCILQHYLDMGCDCADPIAMPPYPNRKQNTGKQKCPLERHIPRHAQNNARSHLSKSDRAPAAVDREKTGVIIIERKRDAQSGYLTLRISMENYRNEADAFGFRLNFPQNLLTPVNMQFGEKIADWRAVAANHEPGSIIFGAFDTEKALPADSQSMIADVEFMIKGIGETAGIEIRVVDLVDDIEDYEIYVNDMIFNE